MRLHRKLFPLYLIFPLIFLLTLPDPGFCFNKWPDTGQELCYDNEDGRVPYESIACPAVGTAFHGQDAQYPMLPRDYTKLNTNDEELADDAANWIMVRDNVTGLTWEVKTDDETIHGKDNTYTWCDTNAATNGGNEGNCGDADTEDFITALNAANFGGHDDWRLPTIKELSSLTHAGRSQPSIDTDYFPETWSYGNYWSSSTNAGEAAEAWYAYFALGNTYQSGDKTNATYFTRAVRGAQNDEPTPRFTDNNDGTITDNATGLMWQKATADGDGDDQPDTMSWQAALAYCENLELGTDAGGASRTDWRLPNRKELQSLIDYTAHNPATSFPGNTQLDGYWSSSSNVWHGWRAWYIQFARGNVYSVEKVVDGVDTVFYVRAVRGYQSNAPFELSVQTVGTGTGSVTSTPAGINCPAGACSETFTFGTFVTLTAAPDADSVFMGWSGSADCADGQISINEAKNCTATFTSTYAISSSAEGNGAIQPAGTVAVVENYDQRFTIIPAEHNHIVDVVVDDESVGAIAEYTFEDVTAEHTIRAVFAVDSNILSVTQTGTGKGTIESNPEGIDCGQECNATYDYGTEVVLTATPDSGSRFTGWTGSLCSGTGSCTVTILDEGVNITAEFTRKFPWSIFLPVILNFRERAEDGEGKPGL